MWQSVDAVSFVRLWGGVDGRGERCPGIRVLTSAVLSAQRTGGSWSGGCPPPAEVVGVVRVTAGRGGGLVGPTAWSLAVVVGSTGGHPLILCSLPGMQAENEQERVRLECCAGLVVTRA